MSVRNALPMAGLVILLAATLPGTAHAAGSLNMNSSMGAYCVGGNCDVVRFALDVQGTDYINLVNLFSDDPNWEFDHLVSVTDANGAQLGWSSWNTGSSMQLSAAGPFAAQPIVITVAMTPNTQSQSQLYSGSLTYSGQGSTYPISATSAVSFGGTVTPEPLSIVLIGSGLVGIAGAARRRRSQIKESG